MNKTKEEVVTEFRQEEILEAARCVFARRGFNVATVDEIAAEAGLAKGTIYLYFRSKQEIYLEALRRSVALLRDETERNMAATLGTRAKLRAFVHTRLSFFERHRDFFKIIHSESANLFTHPVAMRRGLRELYLSQAGALEEALEQGSRQGELRSLPAADVAFLIYDMTRGLVARRLLEPAAPDIHEDTTLVVDLVWEGIRRP
jgi:AcrR family transcriptional regulator